MTRFAIARSGEEPKGGGSPRWALAIACILVSACAGAPSRMGPIAVEEVATHASRREILLVDVRQPHERINGEVARDVTALVPFDRNATAPFVTAMHNVVGGDRTRRVALICVVGARSEVARQALAEAGFTRVVSVEGGFNRWRAAGLPVTRVPE